MAFSSFSKFLFMASIVSWRVPRNGYLSFGNRKKSQEAKSGEYGGWAMTCFVFSQKIQSQSGWNVTAHYRGEKSMSCLSTNPAVYDELLYVDTSNGQIVFLIDRLTL